MDQIKIGAFIAQKRKEKHLTQRLVADRLGITDRAVSKWETGRSLPDASVMLELCDMLGITVNELLTGEELSMETYNEKAEQNLLEAVRQKNAADKRLLTLEIVIAVIALLFMFGLIAVASFVDLPVWARVGLIVFGFAEFLVATAFALRIEQTAGYYECAKCGHRYVPTYRSVTMAMHMGRTRYMTCPRCGKRSWQKKTVGKE